MNTTENEVIETLKTKIGSNNGKIEMPMLKKTPRPVLFWETADKSGFETDRLKGYILKWDHFAKIVAKANESGGLLYRGDHIPQCSGKKLGIDIPKDSMEGFIASELLKIPDGKAITRRSTYYSGILAWANIVELHKSKGKGSYITVNDDFRE